MKYCYENKNPTQPSSGLLMRISHKPFMHHYLLIPFACLHSLADLHTLECNGQKIKDGDPKLLGNVSYFGSLIIAVVPIGAGVDHAPGPFKYFP